MKAIYNFFLITFVIFSSIRYASQYKTLSVEDDDLCSLITKRKIKLGRGDKSALKVIQKRLNDHSLEWNKNMLCRFEVQSGYNKGGILAVIQYLNFRKDIDQNCIDYIQFTAKDGQTSQKYCGNVTASILMDSSHGIVVNNPIAYENSFIDIKGELDVKIFVKKDLSNINMEVNVVFTSYKSDCLDVREHNLVPCSEDFKNVCIDSHFLNDGIVNCPFAGCVDEHDCHSVLGPLGSVVHPSTPSPPQSVGNKVLIGSVSSLFIMFGLFILCVWACRKHKIFCWSDDFAHPTPTPQEQSSRNSRVIEMNEQTGARLAGNTETTAPSAPIEEDKDLPPSYDSLFPEGTTNR